MEKNKFPANFYQTYQIEAENFSHLDQKTQFFCESGHSLFKCFWIAISRVFANQLSNPHPHPPHVGWGGGERYFNRYFRHVYNDFKIVWMIWNHKSASSTIVERQNLQCKSSKITYRVKKRINKTKATWIA